MLRALSIAALLTLSACTCQGLERPQAEAPPKRNRGTVNRNLGGTPQTVVLVVLDTVRADHTSMCGYDRPTTPRMATMARNGAAWSCDVISPAPWTLPSHASFFTGKPVTEHGTMFVANSDVSINSTITARPLAESYETLAEIYAARGYQTVAISANSIVNDASGLLQGFEHRDVSTNGLSFRQRGMAVALRSRLASLDPDKPLFLFVNIYDAHDPYPAIPDALAWSEPQGVTKIDAYTHDPSNPYYAFIKGQMPAEEQATYLERLKDGYDFGIFFADTNLAIAMTMLMRDGWFAGGYRMVITSDHGEFLGEHQLLRHSGFIYEPGVRVPLVFFDTTRRKQPTLPKPMSGVHVYSLVKDGRLPDEPLPPHAVSEKNPEDILIGQIAGAVWDERYKAVCIDGEEGMYDLVADPQELNLLALEADHPLRPRLEQLCADIVELHKRPVPHVDPELTQALKAMGYVSDEELPAEMPDADAAGASGPKRKRK